MSIRFAAPVHELAGRMDADEVCAASTAIPANDNDAKHTSEATMRAALRHFASHGLDAAKIARQNAEKASKKGDEQTFLWWLDICKALDRRMAKSLSKSPNKAAG